MAIHSKKIDDLSINTIRFLAVDGVQKANAGHPGMPMAMAPLGYALYIKYLKHNPANPNWINRDRFILSAGHGSMLLYSLLHLSGYDVPLEELKQFRQWGSITPGHPEVHLTPGVETTTGPLGQGFTNAVGMAIAEAFLASTFNKDDIKLIDHYIYGICSDGDLMEGISHEAASLAGHLKLGNIIFFYDDNGITIDGKTELAFSEDVGKRFEAYGWHITRVDDVNNLDAIEEAVKSAKEHDQPSLIITKTHIGYGSPNKQDSASAHGAPLGEDEVKLTKENLGWPLEPKFLIPDEVKEVFAEVKKNGAEEEKKWNELFEQYKEKYPEEAETFEKTFNGDYGEEWIKHLPVFEDKGESMATRKASGKVLNAIAPYLPTLIGGSADLAPSNNTMLNGFEKFSSENPSGRNFHFGVREHGMGGILNGMALYKGIIPYGGTFLIFSDYMRASVRLAALSNLKTIFVYTHDSIGLGEDGPTHQPIEQLSSLRAIPNLVVIRPADANETAYAWKAAIEIKDRPVALALTRQGLPIIDQNKYPSAEGLMKGAYILIDSEDKPDIILIGVGSEVSVVMKAAEELKSEGVKVRVVSFPSCELFEMQSEEYKATVFPPDVRKRLVVEAGVKHGWGRYIGLDGNAISIEKFGSSAPGKVAMEKYGFTKENVVSKAKELLSK